MFKVFHNLRNIMLQSILIRCVSKVQFECLHAILTCSNSALIGNKRFDRWLIRVGYWFISIIATVWIRCTNDFQIFDLFSDIAVSLTRKKSTEHMYIERNAFTSCV